MAEVILYDLRENKRFTGNEQSIRTLQVYKCGICGALTNHARSVGGPYRQRYAMSVCPNAAEEWHHALRRKLALRNPDHPAGYLRELDDEVSYMRKLAAPHLKDDIIGEADFSQTESVSIIRIDRYQDQVSGEMRECIYL